MHVSNACENAQPWSPTFMPTDGVHLRYLRDIVNVFSYHLWREDASSVSHDRCLLTVQRPVGDVDAFGQSRSYKLWMGHASDATDRCSTFLGAAERGRPDRVREGVYLLSHNKVMMANPPLVRFMLPGEGRPRDIARARLLYFRSFSFRKGKHEV